MHIHGAPHPGSTPPRPTPPGTSAVGATQVPPPRADNDNDADKAVKDREAKGPGAAGSRGVLDITA